MNFPVKGLLAGAVVLLMLAHGRIAVATQTLDAAPRNVQFSGLSTEDGLSSEFVHDLVQDRRGYIWFATQAGLNRFDGHDVRVYEHSSEDPTSLHRADGYLWADSLTEAASVNTWVEQE